MEPRIVSDAEQAQDKLFESKIKELETQFGKPIKVSRWPGTHPELIIENGNELDSSITDKVFELYNQIF